MCTKRYDAESGMRLTDCCGALSSYSDDTLVCKSCYNEVSRGEGDGEEFRDVSRRINTKQTTHKTGTLRDIGTHSLGRETYEYSKCVDCGCEFPHLQRGEHYGASCNGHFISKCPWCRPDSKPWHAGRGL